jgi:hypothetical protein
MNRRDQLYAWRIKMVLPNLWHDSDEKAINKLFMKENCDKTEFGKIIMSLDRMDKRILKALQKDGRIGNAELAKKLGMSATACWNHTKRLMDEGYVKEVRAILDPEKLGLPVLVTVGVVLDRSTPESFAEFEKRCARSPPCRSACCWPASSITGSSCA